MTRILIIHPETPPEGAPIHVKMSTPDVPAAEVWPRAQKEVGGYVEVCTLGSDGMRVPGLTDWHLALYCNENGIAEGLPINIILADDTPIFGPVVIVRERVDDAGITHYADLTPADMRILETFRVIQHGDPG